MDQFRRQFLMAALKLFDVIIMVAVFIGVALIVSLRIESVSFGEFLHMRIDLQNAMYGKGEGANLVLQPFDIVHVPKSAIAEANKWVNQYIEKLILFKGFSAGVTYQINKWD